LTLRKALALIAVLAAAIFVAPGSQAITNGQLDGNGHPYVVLVLMEVDGVPAFRCSGTLLSPTIVVTAGHCTDRNEFSGIRIFAESNVDADPTYPGPGGPNTYEASDFTSHPLYNADAFFLHDVGMIKLATPVVGVSTFGTVPGVNSLDGLRPKRSTTFTSVGYGVQRINPAMVQADRVRMVAHPKLDQINTGFTGDFSLLLSNNAATGGTCFGDSGGPNFLGTSNVIAGVTSFGLNGTCGGTGGVFRLDRQNVRDFINNFISTH
jgi:hypothetical protein